MELLETPVASATGSKQVSMMIHVQSIWKLQYFISRSCFQTQAGDFEPEPQQNCRNPSSLFPALKRYGYIKSQRQQPWHIGGG